MNQKIIDFYLQQGTDHQGRSLNDILAFNDKQLEKTHDYIQWLFPLKEASFFNEHAPILDDETILEFQCNEQLRNNVIIAWVKMMNFYLNNSWISSENHNYLRITRILTFLSLCKLEPQLVCMLSFVLSQHVKYYDLITLKTVKYWIKASATELSATL